MEPTQIPYENTVRMCGRVAQPPMERTLPSGDRLVTMRVIVQRSVRARRRSRITVDAFECVGWTQRVQRSIARLAPDDIVEIEGELRRRFRRVAGSAVSTVEIELVSCRTLTRAS